MPRSLITSSTPRGAQPQGPACHDRPRWCRNRAGLHRRPREPAQAIVARLPAGPSRRLCLSGLARLARPLDTQCSRGRERDPGSDPVRVLRPRGCHAAAAHDRSGQGRAQQRAPAQHRPAHHVRWRTKLAAQVADEVRQHFPAETLPTVIPRSVRISEAPSYGQTVLTYQPSSAGAISYLEAAQEIARRGVEESA